MTLQEQELRSHIRDLILYEQELALIEHDRRIIQEGLFGALKKLGGGVIKTIKEAIAKKVLSLFGINVESVLGKTLVNFFGNLELEDIGKMISGDEQCVTITGDLAAAMIETIIEDIPNAMGIEPGGAFATVLGNALTQAMGEAVKDQIAEALCKIDYKEALKDVPGIGMVLKFVG